MPGTGFRLHSVPVHSGEHSGLNSGMSLFCRNNLSLEWQFGRASCQILFHRNPQEWPDSGRNLWGMIKTSWPSQAVWSAGSRFCSYNMGPPTQESISLWCPSHFRCIRCVREFFLLQFHETLREMMILKLLHIHPNSSSAINHVSWRSQRVVVRSLIDYEPPLSTWFNSRFNFRDNTVFTGFFICFDSV